MAASTKQQTETVLRVEGMSCPSCIRHIDHALKELDGVAEVDVSLREGKVRVRHDESSGVGNLVEALAEAGYPSRAAQ